MDDGEFVDGEDVHDEDDDSGDNDDDDIQCASWSNLRQAHKVMRRVVKEKIT